MTVSWRGRLGPWVFGPQLGVEKAAQQDRHDGARWQPSGPVVHSGGTSTTPELIRTSDIRPADWTLFVHLAADNNLAPFAAEDLREMESVGSKSGKLNVVALVDGSDVYPGVASRARLLYIEKGRSREIAIDPRSDLAKLLAASGNEPNMGDPKLLRAAVEYVRASLAVKKLAVNLWDHGTAWRGIAYDDNPRDHLEIAGGELHQALAGIPIDILAADACLAASVEMACVADKLEVGTLVASEELEPGQGWRYGDLLERVADLLDAKPNAGPRDVGAAFVESYAAGSTANKTLSAFNLYEMGYLPGGVDRFAEAALEAGGLNNNPHLAAAYDKALRFQHGRGDEIDLGSFIREIATTFPSGPLKEAAQWLKNVIEHGAFAKTADPGSYKEAMGLSIYAPKRGQAIDPLYRHPSAAWRDLKWIDLLASGRAPPTSGFVVPEWAKPVPVASQPIATQSTQRSLHPKLPLTVASISPNRDNSISLRGYTYKGRDIRVSTEVLADRNVIRVRLHSDPVTDHESDHDYVYSNVVTLPVPDGNREKWHIQIRHHETNWVIGWATWRPGAPGELSEIL